MSESTKSSEYFARWYEEHKDELSQKRKQRYANDPEYRQKALDARKKQLEANRGLSPLNPAYTTTFSEAAEELGITIWRLRNWRKNHYFPEPYPYGKFLYFTDRQMALLSKLNEFIGEKPRLGKEDKGTLEELTNFIFANWSAS